MEAKEQLTKYKKQGITLQLVGLGPQHWTNQQFEEWLATKSWTEETKEKHRGLFEGTIVFYDDDSFDYDKERWEYEQDF